MLTNIEDRSSGGLLTDDSRSYRNNDAIPAPRFARHLYARDATAVLASAAAPEAGRSTTGLRSASRAATPPTSPAADAPCADAPVPVHRERARLQPSAQFPAVDPETLTLSSSATRRELLTLLGQHLDDARNVEVRVEGNLVVLQGLVSCPLARLMAEDLVYTRPDVEVCHNELLVAKAQADAIAA